jgi:transcriptional regulator with XRE-family HTH domain
LVEINSIMKDESQAAATTGINSRIAARVRSLRAQRGLTLEALATRSEVSRSMLSLVERGESSPTAVVLEKIATGLGVMLASLFDDEPAAESKPVSKAAERSSWRDPQSGYLRCNISPPGYPSPIRIVEVRFPAGASVAYDTAHEDVHQQIWVQQGRIEVTLGALTHKLEEGDCLAMTLEAPVRFHNRTRKPAHYVVVIATVAPFNARK